MKILLYVVGFRFWTLSLCSVLPSSSDSSSSLTWSDSESDSPEEFCELLSCDFSDGSLSFSSRLL